MPDLTFSDPPQSSDNLLALTERLAAASASSLGQRGGVYVADSTAQSGGPWVAIVAHADAVVATMTATNLAGTLANIPLPAGMAIYGRITAFQLSSGKVIAYLL